jgi:hypothetical protein
MTWHLNMSNDGLLDTVILFLSFRHVEVPGHGLLDTFILFLSFRHDEVPGHGLKDKNRINVSNKP